MLESTKRGLTQECPHCGAPPNVGCNGAMVIHAARRNLFFIDSGKKKTKRELRMSDVPES